MKASISLRPNRFNRRAQTTNHHLSTIFMTIQRGINFLETFTGHDGVKLWF